MLADLINARSCFGIDHARDDLHRHATFSCGLRKFLRRMLGLA